MDMDILARVWALEFGINNLLQWRRLILNQTRFNSDLKLMRLRCQKFPGMLSIEEGVGKLKEVKCLSITYDLSATPNYISLPPPQGIEDIPFTKKCVVMGSPVSFRSSVVTVTGGWRWRCDATKKSESLISLRLTRRQKGRSQVSVCQIPHDTVT